MRTLSSTWKVNNVGIFTPDIVDIKYSSLSNTLTTDDGITHIEWIRSKITTVDVSYNILYQDEATYLLNLIQGKEFALTYLDIIEGSKTINCTCKGFTTANALYNAINNQIWTNVNLTFVEK